MSCQQPRTPRLCRVASVLAMGFLTSVASNTAWAAVRAAAAADGLDSTATAESDCECCVTESTKGALFVPIMYYGLPNPVYPLSAAETDSLLDMLHDLPTAEVPKWATSGDWEGIELLAVPGYEHGINVRDGTVVVYASSPAQPKGYYQDVHGIGAWLRLLEGRRIRFSIDPNPPVGSVMIRYCVPWRTEVVVEVFDVAGQRVRVVKRGEHVGDADVRWDGTDETGNELSAGVYVVTLSALGEKRTMRATLKR